MPGLPVEKVRPAQQSPVAVQAEPWGWQVAGGWQVPLLQMPEQQVDAVVQAWPLGRQAGPASGVVPPPSGRPPSAVPVPPSGAGRRGWQAKESSLAARHSVPEQQSLPPGLHGEPTGAQVALPHTRPPSAPGMHSAPLQH